MTAKEYLSQAQHLGNLIDCRMRELEYWRNMAHNLSASNFEPHYNATRSTSATYEHAVEKMDEIQRDIDEKIIHLVDMRDKVNSAIDMLENKEEQIVLRYRYIENFTWNAIGDVMGYSRSTILRIHGNALINFSNFL